MTAQGNHRTSVSVLMGSTVVDAAGRPFGYVKEFAVPPSCDAAHVQGIFVRLQTESGWRSRSGRKQLTMIPLAALQLNAAGSMQLREDASPLAIFEDDNFLLLERDLLDQQIIDVHGHKVGSGDDGDLVWA